MAVGFVLVLDGHGGTLGNKLPDFGFLPGPFDMSGVYIATCMLIYMLARVSTNHTGRPRLSLTPPPSFLPNPSVSVFVAASPRLPCLCRRRQLILEGLGFDVFAFKSFKSKLRAFAIFDSAWVKLLTLKSTPPSFIVVVVEAFSQEGCSLLQHTNKVKHQQFVQSHSYKQPKNSFKKLLQTKHSESTTSSKYFNPPISSEHVLILLGINPVTPESFCTHFTAGRTLPVVSTNEFQWKIDSTVEH
ncbi:hypothetical protein RND71_005857 [Anisodus tanguticus]|uniref:Uncharacterized protein n=1 Tax=Anisodus tanguticus TaxID=243964 RepID=A0AAE1SS97_9SOLA|nr:hypothetical protein RND71_005857 [Anisodus tanguticus]